MSAQSDPESIARALVAGDAIDWDAAQAGARDPAVAAMLRELRIISGIADFHRQPSLTNPADSSPAVMSADVWGHLRLTRWIGGGSFGDVYEAYDPVLDRVVALKLLRGIDTAFDRDDAEAVHEGRVLARVHHPHVVTVFGAARIDGRTGIWMEFIRGRTLADRMIASGPMNAIEAASAARDICEGLTAIHDAGMVHRDIKAQNVIQDYEGRVVLMDLGATLEYTRAGSTFVAGTPVYVAPEVLRGEAATVQSDLYSVGALLWYLTTGSYPVQGASVDELRAEHAKFPRLAMRETRRDLPRRFASIVERALAADSADRFSDARALAEALDRFVQRSARRKRALIASAVVIATGLTVAVVTERWAHPVSPIVPPRTFILVGSFENHTGKDTFERTIQAGLEYELSRSSQLAVVPSMRVDDALKLLRQPIDSQLTHPLAREVAQRDGGIQLITLGSVDTVAGSDVISAQVFDLSTGAPRSAVKVNVASDAQALEALRQLAQEIRRGLGDAPDDSAKSDRRPIALESLRDYSEAVRLGNRGAWRDAIQPAQRAVDRSSAFAMAQIWLAWCESNTPGLQKEVLQAASAAEAAAQEDDVSPREREWVLGSAAHIRDERERATHHYEALLKAEPDNILAVSRLAGLYIQSGSTDQAATMFMRAADLRPSDLRQQAVAIRWLFTMGRNADVVTRYHARALRLLDPPIGQSYAQDASLVLLVPAELSWRTHDAAATTNELARLLSDSRATVNDELPVLIFERVAALYLAMGKIVSARDVIDRISLPKDREFLLATADHYSGDLTPESQHLDRVCYSRDNPQVLQIGGNRLPGCTSLLIESGRLEDARALLKEAETSWASKNATLRASLGQLASADRRADDAIRILPEAIDHLNSDSQYYRAVRALSDAWLQKQRLDTAIGELRSALNRPSSLDAPLEATEISFRLAALYRVAGDVKDAAAVEADALRGLNLADAGFVDRLRAFAMAGIDR